MNAMRIVKNLPSNLYFFKLCLIKKILKKKIDK